jgi:hypothetical protein
MSLNDRRDRASVSPADAARSRALPVDHVQVKKRHILQMIIQHRASFATPAQAGWYVQIVAAQITR